MKLKIYIIFALIIVSSCSSNKNLIGIYKSGDNNYIGNSTLVLKEDKSFSFTINKSMSSDSISGYYEIIGDKIKLVNAFKDFKIIKVSELLLNKSNQKTEISFVNSQYGDSLLINNISIINPFLEKTTVDCNDKLIYKSFLPKGEAKINNVKCGYLNKFKLQYRSTHKEFRDTIVINIKKKKFKYNSFNYKKRKCNNCNN